MAGLNKVMLIGNAGRDPEVHYHDNGAEGGTGLKSATFTLATSERYRDRNGEIRENTEWHNIVAWRNNADICEKYIRKGTQVYIEGRLRTRSWTDANGVKKYQTEIEVQNLMLLSRRESDGTNAAPQYRQPAPVQPGGMQTAPQYQQPAPVQSAPAQSVVDAADASDDLPF